MASAKQDASTSSRGSKVGRPSKFDKRYVDQVFNLALLGLTEAEMADVLGVAKQTLHNWRKAHPEFLDAVNRGKTQADARVARSLYERACGYSHPETVITSYQGEVTKTRVTRHYPPDPGAGVNWLTNRQPSRWRRAPDPTTGDAEAPPPVKVIVQVTDARRRPDPDAEA